MRWIEGFRNWLSRQQVPKPLFTGDSDPDIVSEVRGFVVSLERKEGTLLHEKNDSLPFEKLKPACEGSYYEVSVRATGENEEYPADKEPSVYRYTVLLCDSAGYSKGVQFIPNGYRWTKFRLVEEFNDGTPPGFGKKMPPHHCVMLRADYQAATGNGRELSMGIGGWVRKSERESPTWEKALRSPVTYI